MLKRVLAIAITTLLLFGFLYLVALLGVLVGWYSNGTALIVAGVISLVSFVIFLFKSRSGRD